MTAGTLTPQYLLAPWLAKKVEAGYGGTREEVEAVGATFALGFEELLNAQADPATIPHPGNLRKAFTEFAQASGLTEEWAAQFWNELQSFTAVKPYPYQKLLKPRPLSEVQAEIRRLSGGAEPATPSDKLSNADRCVRQIESHCRLWHTPDGIAYADILEDGHWEPVALESPRFRIWMSGKFHEENDRAVGRDAIAQAVDIAMHRARKGPEHVINLRCAEHNGSVYVDLGRKDWRMVRVDADGWRLVQECPVKFWRPNSMNALPLPEQGGDWQGLKKLINMEDKDWVLVLAWLSFGFYPKNPHPLIILNGEQGSGKSKASELLKRLIDPAKALLMSLPKDERNLKAHAANRWAMVYDNLSGMPGEMSDALCRLATGSGLVDRSLYTDTEESVFEGVRPLVLNGIEALASRPDLLERSLLLGLPTIPEDKRITEAEWEAHLDKIQPQVLGCLLDGVAAGLRNRDKIELFSLPRMADFALWGHAVEGAFGFTPGTFEAAYSDNRNDVHQAAIDNDAIATAIIALIEKRGIFSGSASELLAELNNIVSEEQRRAPDWIKSPRVLGRKLARLAPELRRSGIEIGKSRSGNSRSIQIMAIEPEPVETEIITGDSVVFASGEYPELIFRVIEVTASTARVSCEGYQDAEYPLALLKLYERHRREAG
jgi:hypothetical protein